MADPYTVAGLPHTEVRGPKTATITVTFRDGAAVSTSTWNACHGVGRFVADLLGEPAAHHTIERTTDDQAVVPRVDPQ